jgi:sulfate adenylyltransferase
MKINTQQFSQKWLAFCVWLLLFPLLAQATVPLTADLPSLTLTQRQLCDLELILNGGFDPLDGFMDQSNYERVVEEMRLVDGTVWPMPITLDVTEKGLPKIANAKEIALRDPEGFVIATLEIAQIWQPNKLNEAQKVYGTTSTDHPGVNYLLNQMGDYYVAGKVTKISMPKHYDFTAYRKTPAELKASFKEKGYKRVVGFQTRNPMHRAHLELTLRAAKQVDAHLLLNPTVGMTKPGDVDHFTRVKCYQKLLKYYPTDSTTFSLLPLAMRMAGPREALWHAIIRKNHGCTHFIVGRDHAGPGKDSKGKDFYDPYDAQRLVKAYEDEVGIKMVPFLEVVYVKEDDNYQPLDEVKPGKTILNISGTQLRNLLRTGGEIPAWFSFPEVIKELQKVYPPRPQQGFTLFLTGFSGAGKSTIANALAIKLMELQHRPITLLDGDLIRTHLSSELGFSQEHRSLNVRRVGFVANEITKNHGIAICAMIAPYEQDRRYNRQLIEARGNFIEVFISTSIEECEKRDTKGLYALAKDGKIAGFTGINDPYEAPQTAEITIDTANYSVDEAVEIILSYLRQEKYFD